MRRCRARQKAAGAATLLGLCAFAVAQPLYQVLAGGPTFFPAHGLVGWRVAGFAVLVLLLPPAALLLPLLALGRLGRRAWLRGLAAACGLLVAATLLPPFCRGLGDAYGTAAALGIAGAAVYGYSASAVARRFARATALVAPVFTLVFLLSPGIMPLLGHRFVGDRPRPHGSQDVMIVVFDELPLAALLDAQGRVDAARFPSFAALARESTWYRNASTVAPWTHLAVPALLSGILPPTWETPPTVSSYPRNLFTLLASSHAMRVDENATFLCPPVDCHAETAWGTLARDTGIVYLDLLLPPAWAQGRLPPIGDRWAGFGESDRVPAGTPHGDWRAAAKRISSRDRVAPFERLVRQVETTPADGPPLLTYVHVLLPHLPAQYLPDGTLYARRVRPPGLSPGWVDWDGPQGVVDDARQRFLLQARFVDRLLGELLAALVRSGRFDRTLLVVASDHGIAFVAGEPRRGGPLRRSSREEVLAVPLFCKYPRQRAGRVDDRPAQIIDVLPTVVDALDISLPPGWHFDGRSLLSSALAPVARTFLAAEGKQQHPRRHIDLLRGSRRYRQMFGHGGGPHDVYAWGPHRDLVGKSLGELLGPDPSAPLRATLLTSPLRDYDPKSDSLPALAELVLDPPAAVEGWIAVSLHGTIAGVGPVVRWQARRVAWVMLDPVLIRPGDNRVGAALISGDRPATPLQVM